MRAVGTDTGRLAEREGISAQWLERWQACLSEDFEEVAELVEVTAEAGESDLAGDGCMFEVMVVTGRRVRVPSDFDAAALRRLLAVLEDRPC